MGLTRLCNCEVKANRAAKRAMIEASKSEQVASVLNNLAGLLESKGDYAAAEPLYREALAMTRSTLGDEHPLVGRSLRNLAVVLKGQGKMSEAEPLAREARVVLTKTLPEEHWLMANVESMLGSCLAALERYEEAEPLLLNAHPAMKVAKGENNWRTIQALGPIAQLYAAWGWPEQAADWQAKLPTDLPAPTE